MKNVTFRTDLAIEEVAKIDCNKIEGVNTKEFTCFNILINNSLFLPRKSSEDVHIQGTQEAP